jgi:ketosteroid isomerase-like protein
MKNLILLAFAFSICTSVFAQSQNERKVTSTPADLYNKIANLDSALFAAYNSKNLDLMKTYFTQDLEWYQDNGGLIGFEKVFSNFQSIFNREYDLKRNLLKESLEVHPIEGYGAIEIGKHQFKHIENGKLEIGTFKFLMIWKNDNGSWKIARVISYDH